MRTAGRIAALHGALWTSDRWYRVSWYVWPASLALLIAGWICVGKTVPVAPPAGSWARPTNQTVTPAKSLPNFGLNALSQCFSGTIPAMAAIGSCSTAINGGQVKGRQLATAYNQRGYLQRDQQPDSALADYNAALKLEPNLAEALNNRAWIYMSRGDYDGAVKDLNKAIELLPPNSAGVARYYRGFAFLRLKQFPQALADLNEALRLRPDNADFYLARGETRQALQDYDAALQDFDQFGKRAPKDARGLILRGAVLEAMGRAPEALAALGSAVALEPNNAQALAERDRLRAQQNEGNPSK